MRKSNQKTNRNNAPITGVVEEIKAALNLDNSGIKAGIDGVKEAEVLVLLKLREAHKALVTLSSKRLESKLSNTRVIGVARELNELIKVMSVYETA